MKPECWYLYKFTTRRPYKLESGLNYMYLEVNWINKFGIGGLVYTYYNLKDNFAFQHQFILSEILGL